jgi:signal transduction histidine kinase/CheY-like chemotaxis protein
MQRSEATAAQSTQTTQDALLLLESSSVFGCVIVEHDGRIRWVNALFRSWLENGVSNGDDLRRLSDWFPGAEEKDAIQRALANGGVSQIALRLGCKEGALKSIVGDLVPLPKSGRQQSYAGFFHEADSDRKLRAGLERSARLEALGSLTSGVAHDFNNLLTILVGNLSLVAEELRTEPRQFAKLKAARDAARRGGELIKQLLSFARQEPVASERINPSKVIARIAPLVQRALGNRIKFELDLDEHVDPVQGNSAQLESVIVNLAVNARDAIDNQGTVRIRVASSSTGETVRGSRGLGQSRELIIEVIDDGAGIPADVVARVFEPFFTTKTNDKGSGLGLSMVKQYAEQFGGRAEVASVPGAGTTVRLSFPSAPGTVNDSAAMTMPLAALPSGDENVVVLARDENLCAMINQILSVLGYRVRVAGDLRRASELLQEALPALVICDGFEVRSLIEAHTTGTASTQVLMLQAQGAEAGNGQYRLLDKPFSIPDLAVTVREALDAR